MQFRLMNIAINIKPNHAIIISNDVMREATKGELSSLLFDSVRETDVKAFAKKVATNWGIKIQQIEGRDWEFYKPENNNLQLKEG